MVFIIIKVMSIFLSKSFRKNRLQLKTCTFHVLKNVTIVQWSVSAFILSNFSSIFIVNGSVCYSCTTVERNNDTQLIVDFYDTIRLKREAAWRTLTLLKYHYYYEGFDRMCFSYFNLSEVALGSSYDHMVSWVVYVCISLCHLLHALLFRNITIVFKTFSWIDSVLCMSHVRSAVCCARVRFLNSYFYHICKLVIS